MAVGTGDVALIRASAQRRRSLLSLLVTLLMFAQASWAEDTIQNFGDLHTPSENYLAEEARLLSATPAPTFETAMPTPTPTSD